MSPIAKLIMYAGLAALVGILGYCFGVEHSEVLAGHVNASRSRMMGYLGGFFASLIVMGLRLAYDLSQFLGERAENSFLEGDAPLPEAQDLVEAAQLHSKGAYLDAIRLLREYLDKHPAEANVQQRIAEIYSKDLKNPLAAALEYEGLLEQKLPEQQWGWAALHLVKLYWKLGEPEKADQLLERLQREHGNTFAARRARKLTVADAGAEGP